MGAKVKSIKSIGFFSSNKVKTPVEEARDILKNVILAHIPMNKHMPFFTKCRYLGLMTRRVIEAL